MYYGTDDGLYPTFEKAGIGLSLILKISFLKDGIYQDGRLRYIS